ncbi:MAG: hypothetical protein H6626_09110 [Pseudobdellovibrionaceae bacterium]|nr:MAG: hypothetical protein H6626_09110 [Pseudobdellovibrionaceae bacterium]
MAMGNAAAQADRSSNSLILVGWPEMPERATPQRPYTSKYHECHRHLSYKNQSPKDLRHLKNPLWQCLCHIARYTLSNRKRHWQKSFLLLILPSCQFGILAKKIEMFFSPKITNVLD